MVDDACEEVGSDVELVLRVVKMEAQFRVQEGDHARKEFLLFCLGGKFELADMLNGLLHRDLLLIDLDELPLSLLLDLVWHLRLAHFREV